MTSIANGASENRADHRRDRQRVEVGEIRRRPRGRQDVAGPAHRSRGGERQTHRIEVADFDAGEAEQCDTGQREHRPQPGARPSAHHHRKCQRAKHFDGHRHSERNPGQRIVKAQVHHRQAGCKACHRKPRAFGQPQHARPDRRAQDHPGDEKTNEHRPCRAQGREQTDGKRGPDLLAHRGDDDQQRRANRRPGSSTHDSPQ